MQHRGQWCPLEVLAAGGSSVQEPVMDVDWVGYQGANRPSAIFFTILSCRCRAVADTQTHLYGAEEVVFPKSKEWEVVLVK